MSNSVARTAAMMPIKAPEFDSSTPAGALQSTCQRGLTKVCDGKQTDLVGTATVIVVVVVGVVVAITVVKLLIAIVVAIDNELVVVAGQSVERRHAEDDEKRARTHDSHRVVVDSGRHRAEATSY